MRGLTLTTAPAVEPLSLAEAKDHLKVEIADDDPLIAELITAARKACEHDTGRALVTQTWTLSLDAIPGKPLGWWDGVHEAADTGGSVAAIELPRAPLQSVTSITGYDDEDSGALWAATNYFVDTQREPGRVVLRSGQSWPTFTRVANGLVIVFVAGYGDAGIDVPGDIRLGMLELIGRAYEEREAITSGTSARWLPYRLLRV